MNRCGLQLFGKRMIWVKSNNNYVTLSNTFNDKDIIWPDTVIASTIELSELFC